MDIANTQDRTTWGETARTINDVSVFSLRHQIHLHLSTRNLRFESKLSLGLRLSLFTPSSTLCNPSQQKYLKARKMSSSADYKFEGWAAQGKDSIKVSPELVEWSMWSRC